jgi:DNA invertase Pin-like site-specific DNA recombinase
MITTHSNSLSAILYVRVSTEEQAIRGGSLKTQEDTLRQYCHLRNIMIKKIYVEDHSAKTFNRPEWKKLMAEIQNSKPPSELLLFTRWDRFSRNTGDAYSTIKVLRNIRVDPQAIEQPLDLSVPENKMMLAFYLAIPEVENDRRGLNTKMGMQRAKETGRVLGRAPIGYANYCYPNGFKGFVLKYPEASIIEHAFARLANSKCKITDAYSEVLKEGLKCSRSNFWKLLQNPVYAGNVKITDNSNTKSYVIPGQHKGIVSVEIFDKIQLLYFGKKKCRLEFHLVNNRFPMKGFLSCPHCGKRLTASASSGRRRKYFYYHCLWSCGYRIRSEKIYEMLLQKLTGLIPKKEYADLYTQIISESYSKENRRLAAKKMKALTSIELFTDRITKAKNLLLDSHIDFEGYSEIKSDLEAKIQVLGYTVQAYSQKQIDLTDKIKKSACLISDPKKLFQSLDETNRPSLLNRILVRSQNWEQGNSNHIFQESFRAIYALDERGEEAKICDVDIKATLETMANLELLLIQ